MAVDRTLTLLLALLFGCLPADAQAPPDSASTIPKMPSRLNPIEGELWLEVIDGALVELGEQTVLVGGMTRDFNATPAIQVRRPDGTWLPVGNQMIRARIEPDALALPDGRIFVWGGFSGSARGELTLELNGELLDPRVAGSSRLVTPPASEIPWRAPSAPSLLEDGTIAIAAGNAIYRLDPIHARWKPPLALEATLVAPALCQLDPTRLLLVSTDAGAATSHVFEVDWTHDRVEPWERSIPAAVPGAKLYPVSEGRVLALGWPAPSGLPSTRSFLLDTTERSIEEGPALGHDADGPGWFGACQNGNGVLVLLTPSTQTNDQTQAYLLRIERNGSLRAWQLTNPPPGRRQMFLTRGDRGVELLGGYRFLSSSDARREGVKPGATLLRSSVLLEYGTGPIGD